MRTLPELLRHRLRAGFTLIEMSIVLVIIALIIGGVVAGQAMLEQSQIRRLAAYPGTVSAAVNAFKLKYNAIPGDMAAATQFLSGVTNGNGNGSVAPVSAAPYESGGFWQHLAVAGFIDGEFNGDNYYNASDSPYNISRPNDLSSPRGQYRGGAWWGMRYFTTTTAWYPAGAFVPGHMMMLSSPNSCYGATIASGSRDVLSISEMSALDTKYDDGLPNSGNVAVINSNTSQGASGCFVGESNTYCMLASASAWSYTTAAASLARKSCAPLFRLPF